MWKYASLALLALAACGPSIPDGGYDMPPADIGYGVGFGGSYDDASGLDREFGLDGVDAEPVISAGELAAAGLPAGGGQVGLPATEPVTSAPLDARVPTGGSINRASSNNVGISDEQSFEAVSARETIESDAERLARQAQAYRVIQPTAVPTRSGEGGPNIVAFALSTDNPVGQAVHRRGGILPGEGRARRACARYPSPDLAQETFLARGGPERDRLGLDPDGDGFACGWDPAPFRAARN